MATIENLEQFIESMKSRPPEWSIDVSSRVAFRALPLALSDPAVPKELSDEIFGRIVLGVLRYWAVYGSVEIGPIAVHTMAKIAKDMASVAKLAAQHSVPSNDLKDCAAFATMIAALCAAWNAVAAYRSSDKRNLEEFNKIWESVSGFFNSRMGISKGNWTEIQRDCSDLELVPAGDLARGRYTLQSKSLWVEMPSVIDSSISKMSLWLDDINGSQILKTWFAGLVKNQMTALSLNFSSEKSFKQHLTTQNNSWWSRDLSAVLEDIEGWIEDEKILESPKTGLTPFSDINTVPQIRSAPTFRSTESHKLSINFDQDSDALRTDQDSVDRHSELRTELYLLKEQCQGSNSLGHVVNLADRLLEALGSEVGEMRTSLVVQRGERIRQLAEIYENLSPTSLHEKVDEFVFNQLKATRDALNMVVGLDPVLDNLDRARLGPDIEMSMVSPSEVKERFEDLADREIVTQETREFVEEAVDLAPTVPDPENRQSRTVDLLAQNFVRYSIEIISAYPEQSAWVAASTGVVAAATLGLASTGGGMVLVWALAKTILRHEDKFRSYIGNSPANQANFDKLIVFLKTLPL
ncbi:hypothetical protein [Parasphingorhabdus sp.]|uniref:hypothetical protein n=1 Tax=Parasphingorhabdus sp. TaxID=2709688 RepID=UPI0032EE6EE0